MAETDGLEIVELDSEETWAAGAAMRYAHRARTRVLVGVSRDELPAEAAAVMETLAVTLAPSGPGRSWVAAQDGDLDLIRATVRAAPRAAATLVSLLPVIPRVDVAEGLIIESLAYSMLLAGPEFRQWRTTTPQGGGSPDDDSPVLLSRDGDILSIVLNRPDRHNAFGRAVRDGLIEGLEMALQDPSIAQVRLTGRGRSFCSGGDLDEFGTTPDVVTAHLLRVGHSAGHLVHLLRDRVVGQLHGACIGAGIEIPAFAGRVEALEGTWFRLPELAMGLIPGAGGTVSVTRRIGRWRTAYMTLTGRKISLQRALDWGLVDACI